MTPHTTPKNAYTVTIDGLTYDLREDDGAYIVDGGPTPTCTCGFSLEHPMRDSVVVLYCASDGRDYVSCDDCDARYEIVEREEDAPEVNPRERGDDDGVEYSDPRDEMEDRL